MSNATKIIGVTVGTPQNPEKITKGYVPESRKIAGFELSRDITGEELRDALDVVGIASLVVNEEVLPYTVDSLGDVPITSYGDLYRKLTYYDYDAAVPPKQGLAYFTIDKGGLNGSTSNINLPEGNYLTTKYIGNGLSGMFTCLNILTSTSYTVEHTFEPNSGTSYAVYTDKVAAEKFNDINARIDEVKATLGDIDTALDELHTYAQSLISGGAAE